ncbi:hypothetical protein ACWFRF_13130 [Nocardia sp. NPDC055165]|uniref:hypothetical protein n=1 Tax=Nocardia sp. NPDC060220 TaxID=3347076 RepID=UPI00364C2239
MRLTVGLTTVVAISLLGAGTASAEVREAKIQCLGSNANFHLYPFYLSLVATSSDDRPGTISIQPRGDSNFGPFGYHATVNWTNLDTGESGVVAQDGTVGADMPSFDVNTGWGTVRLTGAVGTSGLSAGQTMQCSGADLYVP